MHDGLSLNRRAQMALAIFRSTWVSRCQQIPASIPEFCWEIPLSEVHLRIFDYGQVSALFLAEFCVTGVDSVTWRNWKPIQGLRLRCLVVLPSWLRFVNSVCRQGLCFLSTSMKTSIRRSFTPGVGGLFRHCLWLERPGSPSIELLAVTWKRKKTSLEFQDYSQWSGSGKRQKLDFPSDWARFRDREYIPPWSNLYIWEWWFLTTPEFLLFSFSFAP